MRQTSLLPQKLVIKVKEGSILPVGYMTNIGANVDLGPEWLDVKGQELRISDYPELYNVIGDVYGCDGYIFHVPDYRGKIVTGWINPQITLNPEDHGEDDAYLDRIGYDNER